MSAAVLWEKLQAEGLVEGDYAPPTHVDSPWFVRVMLGIAGWIGAIFLLFFVGMAFAFVMSSAAAALILGLAGCGVAFLLFRAFDGNDFAEQFGLAVSIAGQTLIGIGLAQTFATDDPSFFLTLAVIEALLVLAVSNFLHRVLSAAAAGILLALGFSLLQLHGLAAPLIGFALASIWLEPRRWATGGRMWRPVGYGLVLALLLVETFRLFDLQSWWGPGAAKAEGMVPFGPLIGRALTAAILLWVAVAIALREGAGKRLTWLAAGGAALFGTLALPAPGLASALLVLVLGFSAGNRLLLALGILALLGFVSHFYYSLHISLLEKSGLLAATGLVLLAAYGALRHFHSAEAVTGTGHA